MTWNSRGLSSINCGGGGGKGSKKKLKLFNFFKEFFIPLVTEKRSKDAKNSVRSDKIK